MLALFTHCVLRQTTSASCLPLIFFTSTRIHQKNRCLLSASSFFIACVADKRARMQYGGRPARRISDGAASKMATSPVEIPPGFSLAAGRSRVAIPPLKQYPGIIIPPAKQATFILSFTLIKSIFSTVHSSDLISFVVSVHV